MSQSQIGVPREEPDEDYGHALAYVDGEFVRNSRGRLAMKSEAGMVADELARTLETPIGDDPWRPNFGLDRQKFTTSDPLAREAIIEAIGPEADPRVDRIDSIDIKRPPGERQHSRVIISLTLRDGTPMEFRAAFESLVGYPGPDRGGNPVGTLDRTAARELSPWRDYREGKVDEDESEDGPSGWGYDWGDNWDGSGGDQPTQPGEDDGTTLPSREYWNMLGVQLGDLGLPPGADEDSGETQDTTGWSFDWGNNWDEDGQ